MRPLKYGIMVVGMGFLAACAGPIETRIDTAIAVPPAKGSTYLLSISEGPTASTQNDAAMLLDQRLTSQGLTRTMDAETAQYVVSLGLADRPADVGYSAGGEALATPKKKRALQSCSDREYRVTIAIMQVADGMESYRGSASEYHCKANLADVMPHLMDSALSGFAGQNGARIETRNGVD